MALIAGKMQFRGVRLGCWKFRWLVFRTPFYEGSRIMLQHDSRVRGSRVWRANRVVWAALISLMVGLNGTAIRATAQDVAEKKPETELKPFKVRVVDEEKQPVAGAKIIASGLRCYEQPGSAFFWPTTLVPRMNYLTDQNGEIEIQYPAKFGSAAFWLTPSKLILRFQHADFVAGELEVDPANEEAEQTLRKGCRAAFRSVDESGAAVSKAAVLMAGKGAEAIWKMKDGTVSSGGIPKGTWQTMLVSPSADGRHLFSDIIDFVADPGDAPNVQDVTLRPGLVVRGALSANVPRPIKNASLSVWCLPKPAGEGFDNQPSQGWAETAKINEDGTFEFLSLPRGGRIQMFALCDGWVIEGNENGFIVGNEFDVTEVKGGTNQLEGVVLEMEQAGTVEVLVLGPDGKPLEGAEVSTSPNQKMNLYGTTILGSPHRSMAMVDLQISGTAIPAYDYKKERRYLQMTDKHGKATIREIPLNSRQSLSVGKKDYSMNVPSGGDAFQGIRFECKEITPIQLSVEMQKIEEPSVKPSESGTNPR